MEDTKNQRLTKYNPVPPERKQEIVEDALVRIENETLEQIAQSHGITGRTLQAWVDAVPEYEPIRNQIYLDRYRRALEEHQDSIEQIKGSIEQAKDEEGRIDAALAQLLLARARALDSALQAKVKSAQWELERRDRRYAGRPQVAVQVNVGDDLGLVGRASDLLDRTIDNDN